MGEKKKVRRKSCPLKERLEQFKQLMQMHMMLPLLLAPEEIGVQNFSEFLLRMGPTPCKVDELMTDGPCRNGVMGAVAEVGGWGNPSGKVSEVLLERVALETRFSCSNRMGKRRLQLEPIQEADASF